MLAPGKLYVNTALRITVNFQDSSGSDVDPDTVSFLTRSPCGTETTYAYGTDSNVGRSSAGDYYADIQPDVVGRWYYRWATTGTGTTTALEGSFIIQWSPFSAFNDTWWTGGYWYW